MSALMASHGYTASARALEAPRLRAGGVDQVRLARGRRRTGQALRDQLQQLQTPSLLRRWSTAPSTPYAQLRARITPARTWSGVELKVHPLVLELTGKEPIDGLAQFSVYHGCARSVWCTAAPARTSQ